MQVKYKKALLWIIGSILFLCLIILLVNPLLTNILEKKIDKNINGKVKYKYADLKINLLKRSVNISKIRWYILKNGDTLQFGSCENLELKGIGALAMFFGSKSLKINKIKLNELNICIFPTKDTSIKPILKPYDLLKNEISTLNIAKIETKNGNIIWLNKNKSLISKLSGISLKIANLKLDKSTAEKLEGWFSMEKYSIEIDSTESMINKNLHVIKTSKLVVSHQEEKLCIDSFRILPLYSKNELAKVYGYQTNWMKMNISKIHLHGFSFHQLIYHQRIISKKLQVENLVYTAFREKAYAYHPDRYTILPHIAFQNLKIPVAINSISIRDAYLQYEEHVPPANENGKFFMTNVNIDIQNFKNFNNKEAIRMTASARLLGIALLTANFSFPMNSKSGIHSVKGKLESLDLTSLNQVFEPLAFFSIRSGKMQSMNFHFQADNQSSKGEISFNYEDLKIKLINKENLDKSGFLKDLISFLANNVLVNGNNSHGSSAINYQRNMKKSVFNYWWKSIFSGMESTVVRTDILLPKGKK